MDQEKVEIKEHQIKIIIWTSHAMDLTCKIEELLCIFV